MHSPSIKSIIAPTIGDSSSRILRRRKSLTSKMCTTAWATLPSPPSSGLDEWLIISPGRSSSVTQTP